VLPVTGKAPLCASGDACAKAEEKNSRRGEVAEDAKRGERVDTPGPGAEGGDRVRVTTRRADGGAGRAAARARPG
jgi:hypothetical protein